MKKSIALTVFFAAAAISFCACGNNSGNTQESSEFSFSGKASVPAVSFEKQASSEPSQNEKSELSQQSEKSAEEQSSRTAAELPDGVIRTSKGKLKFTTSVLSLSVTFSDEFCIRNNDYNPKYGIYLQNTEGTATLLLESVEDKTLSYRNMTAYLREQYPEARVYATDNKEIVCKMNSMDQSGNKICIMQKLRVRTGGYNCAVICCRTDDKAKYEAVLNDITYL